MAASSAIPAKYMSALCMYAAAILLDFQERENEAMKMYLKADAKIFEVYGADDSQLNSRRIETTGVA